MTELVANRMEKSSKFESFSFKQKKSNPSSSHHKNVMSYVILALISAIQIQTQVASTVAKELSANGAEQIKINNKEDKFNFYSIPKGASATAVPLFEEKNQKVQKERDFETNKNLILRQDAEISESNLNTSSSNGQQSQAMATEVIKMSNQMTSQLLR